MHDLELIQGSQKWLDARLKYRCASEAPVMMGDSSKATRNELLHIKATGDEKEFSEWVQKHLFDKGHEYEELARPIAEKLIGEEFYPITGVDDEGYLLASFDGLTMGEDVIFEHKMPNVGLIECVNNRDLQPENYWQLEQQLLVSGAEYCLFAVSDGTKDNFVSMYYYPAPGRAEQLLAGWKQFDIDVENYNPPETNVVPVGLAPENLPALHIVVNGMVTESNLTKYKEHALAVFGDINKDLKTDKDFANAEKTVKWCKSVEDKLEAAKQHALGQTASIDELFSALDDIKEQARTNRLELDKLVKNRKAAIRVEILNAGKKSLANHIDTINRTLSKLCLPAIPVDFAAAMKGKKTVTSLESAADDELAKAKIEANRIGDIIRVNLLELQVLAKGYEFLFVDAQQLVLKDNDDLKNLINARVAEHKKAEEEKKAAEEARLAEEKRIADEAKELVDSKPEPKLSHKYVPHNDTSTAVVATANKSPQILNRKTQITKPSDTELINVIAIHYNVYESTVIDWLANMDLSIRVKTGIATNA